MNPNSLTWSDFEKVDIRSATVINAEDFPEARNPAYKLTLDFGLEIGILRSSAQITRLYRKEDLIGRQVLAVVNFPPKQIGPFISQCLVLGTVGPDKTVTLLQPERKVENGLRVA